MRPPGFRIPPYGVGVAGIAAIIRRLNERAWLVAEMRRGITALHDQGALREGLALDEAVDSFFALAGTDVYRSLVREHGREPDRYEAWLFRLGCTELLGAPPTEPPPVTP